MVYPAPMRLARVPLDSPIGPITITASPRGITAVAFATAHASDAHHPVAAAFAADAARQLTEYFSSTRADFDLPLAPEGTPFQHRVWTCLRSIPHGETRAYADVARALGHPDASRAVGAANAANPIAIIIPCHRVIAADGTLHGYAGGLHRKRWLLDHELALAGIGLFPCRHP